MAIRNTLLGGTDFYLNEVLFPTDMNDTIDQIVGLVEGTI